MRKPKLTVDAFVAALAVLAPLASQAGCSKVERAAPEAPAVAPASTTKAAPTETAATEPPSPPPPAPPAAPVVAEDPSPNNRGAAASIDAGKELKKAAPKGGAHAACGATGCSPDMKKQR